MQKRNGMNIEKLKQNRSMILKVYIYNDWNIDN